jgi:CHASE2 domain
MADNPKGKRSAFVVCVYVGLIVLALLMESPNHVTELIHHWFGKDCKGREETTVTSVPYKIISNFYSAPGELKVRLVTLDKGSEPRDIFGDENLCRQRFFMAMLIQRLEDLGAKSIVVDKYFAPHTCENLPSGPQNGTDALLRVVNATSVPITLGLHTAHVGGVAGTSPEIKTCLVLADALRFGSGKCQGESRCVDGGAIRLNSDTRRIPIDWEVFQSEREAEQNENPRIFRSLSLVAAQQSDPEGKARERLVELLKDRDPSHPFTSFVREIPQFHARQVLCGIDFPENAGSDWDHTCKPPEIEGTRNGQSVGALTDAEIASEIRGQTIVIGELSDEDMHNSVIGESVPGALLQANYIQSLLEGRYFPAVPGVVSFLWYLAWFSLTFLLFLKKTPNTAAVWSLVALCVLVIASILVMKYMGRIVPWGLEGIFSLFAVIGLHWVHATGHHEAK